MEHSFKEALLYVENLSVAYDDKVIIKDISLIEKDVVRAGIENTGSGILQAPGKGLGGPLPLTIGARIALSRRLSPWYSRVSRSRA